MRNGETEKKEEVEGGRREACRCPGPDWRILGRLTDKERREGLWSPEKVWPLGMFCSTASPRSVATR